jgi:hypothetical protein
LISVSAASKRCDGMLLLLLLLLVCLMLVAPGYC